MQKNHSRNEGYIRGVNIGGWLMAERFITPYLFAVNSCHLQGSLCWYPGQIGSPSTPTKSAGGKSNVTADSSIGNANVNSDQSSIFCDTSNNGCQPVLVVKAKTPTDYHLIRGLPSSGRGINDRGMDYPVDEYTLGHVLRQLSPGGIDTATKYMERHWDTFVTYEDLKTLKDNGVTHLRIPMGYWIRGKPGLSLIEEEDEPYIPGGWKYFVRACNWCRQLGLQVWADLHGAPGSENGFDNSGRYLGKSTCKGWSNRPDRVQRTVEILTDLVDGVRESSIDDVVTGFGILNEPFVDCDLDVLKQYYETALSVVRNTLGSDTAIFIGDTFRAYRFNDGVFWNDPKIYNNTYLDSHPYHVFFEQGRSFTPRQHIAYVCRHDTKATKDCCYEQGQQQENSTKIPSKGISRLIGEWSGAYDTLPTALTPQLMKGIATDGTVPRLNRTLSSPRKRFLRNFVEAQMVAYEAADEPGVSSGWLFWNFKMEGGAFAEWDFLRGLREGWMPPIPDDPTVTSESLYGSCYDIYNRTDDDYSIVNEYPDPRTLDWNQWQGWDANDDFVMSDPKADAHRYHEMRPWYDPRRLILDQRWFMPLFVGVIVFVVFNKLRLYRQALKRRETLGYTELK